MQATPPGRREARKRAVRAAIKQAADRLIAEQGFEQTTVRQIAEAAQVTERTFYRYFDGKEGIVAEEADRWIQRLGDAIAARPAEEPPLASVRAALLGLARELGRSPERGRPPEQGDDHEREFVWLLADRGGAVEALRRSGTRPLLRLEARITESLAARTGATQDSEPGAVDPFELAVVGRVSAALLRSVMIERRRERGGAEPIPGTGELVERAFGVLPGGISDPA